jgi:hypothetical protein
MTAMPGPLRRSAPDPGAHVLVVGRSPSVLEEAVDLLRERGLRADATNAFDRVLQDYDGADLDVVVFGGLVPPATKEHLGVEIARLNPAARFVQGLVGIAGVITAQVDELLSGVPRGRVTYDDGVRSIVVELAAPARVVVDVFWVTGLTPPEPTSTQARVLEADLAPGVQQVPLPDALPDRGVFAAVRVDDRVAVLTVAPMPAGIAAAAATLPAVRSVTTQAGSPAEARS